MSTPGSSSEGAGAKTRTAPLISGELLGKIHIPKTVANLCFGGTFQNRLYIIFVASSSLYAAYTSAQGAFKP